MGFWEAPDARPCWEQQDRGGDTLGRGSSGTPDGLGLWWRLSSCQVEKVLVQSGMSRGKEVSAPSSLTRGDQGTRSPSHWEEPRSGAESAPSPTPARVRGEPPVRTLRCQRSGWG